MHDVVVGEDHDRPAAGVRRLADGVGHVGGLGQVGVVETHAVPGLAVLQLRAQHLAHEVLVLEAVAHVGVVHLLRVRGVRDGAGVTQPLAPPREHPHLQLRPGNRDVLTQRNTQCSD